MRSLFVEYEDLHISAIMMSAAAVAAATNGDMLLFKRKYRANVDVSMMTGHT